MRMPSQSSLSRPPSVISTAKTKDFPLFVGFSFSARLEHQKYAF